MRRICTLFVAGLAVTAFAACSDDTTTTPKLDTGPGMEASTNEAGTDTTPNEGVVPLDGTVDTDNGSGSCVAAKIGTKCASDTECGGSMVCLGVSSTFGLCTCTCTPKDPNQPLVTDSCPGQPNYTCGEIQLQNGTTKNYCLKVCTPKIGSNDCIAGVVCHPFSGYYGGIYDYDKAVCLLTGCTADSDCPVTTGQSCDTTLKNCPTGETCVALSSTGTDGMCAKDGSCDTVSGLCKPHTLGTAGAKIGGACKGDTDCANGQECFAEVDLSKTGKAAGATCTSDSDCCSRYCNIPSGSTSGTCSGACKTLYRNGYCTITGCMFSSTLTSAACGTGAGCNKAWVSGFCQTSCTMTTTPATFTLDSSCRGNALDQFGDYDCRDWSQLVIGTTPIATEPLCDFGFGAPCDMFKNLASAGYCAAVGNSSNSTGMKCRDMQGNELTNSVDPAGLCLDLTVSALPATPTPDAGP